MNVENNERRPVVRKTVVYQPASYIGFCDSSEVSKNNLNKRKMKSSTWEALSTKSSRSGASPVKKYAKLIEEPTNEKSNHDYIIEQKKKWRQKLKSDEDLKKNINEKKKQSLQDLQIKSKLLLKRNLKRKTKNPSKNSPCPPSSLNKGDIMDTGINKAYHRIIDTSKIVPEKHEIPRLDSLPKNNDIQIISSSNANLGIDALCEPAKVPVMNPVNEVPSSQEVLPSDSNEGAGALPPLPSDVNSPILKSAGVQIQSCRGYGTTKHIEPLELKYDAIQLPNEILPTDNQKDKVSKSINNVHQIKENFSKSRNTLSIPNMSVNYPYNFIAAVKKKLSKSIDAPPMKTNTKDDISAQFNMSPLEKLRKECLMNPSFFTIYNQNLDSVYVMPTTHTFPDDTRNKPFFSESTLLKHLDATINNSSHECSVFKKPKTLAALPPDPQVTKDVLQKSTIVSELKSSLQEIQNLTVSITFNEQVDKDQILSSESHKKDIKRNKILTTNSDHTYQECVRNHKNDDYCSSKNALNAPDINLVWPRKIDVDKESFGESTFLTHRQFTNELTLLDSFNESLRQVQVVEETLSTMRQNLNSSNSSQFTNFQSGNDSTSNTWHQLEENLNNISSIKVSSNANISQSIKENDHLTQLHLEHKLQGITTFNSLNKSHRSSNVYNQSQMCDVMKSFEGINAGPEIHNDIFKSHVVTALDAIRTDSRACSQTEFLNHNNTITNILDQFSGNQSLTGNITDQNDVVSTHEISSNTSFNSNKLKDISLCDDVGLSNHLNKFCVCLITQYIEDEKVRSEYLNTLLKVREKTLLDATRLELLCLQMQKKQNHELVPLLKKKQRGLLLKSQQERNEIKHIKKFQEEQSQERKATLKRQLKNLKRMFSCEGSVLDFKKKSSSLKNSTLILQSKGGTQNSPVKGINISFTSEANASNSTYGHVQQSLEKKKVDLSKQKRKLNELLHMHYDVQLDAAEIKAMEHRLQNPQIHINNADANADVKKTTNSGNMAYIASAIDSHSFNPPEAPIESVNITEACDSNAHIHSEEFHVAMDTYQDEVGSKAPLSMNESQSRLNATVDTKLFGDQQDSNDVSSDAAKADYNFVLSGYSLNKLWEKITGDNYKKYDDKEDYHMSKDSLDYFFEEAKQFALQDLLKTLQCNLPQNVDNFSLAKANKADESARELVTKISHIPAQSINTSSQCNFNTEDCNNYSSSLLKSSNEQGNNNTNILNNLIQSNSYHPTIQLMTANHPDKLAVIEEVFEVNNLNEDAEIKSQDNNVLSDTFTIKENLSIDSSDQSDSSKSTAHSLVEELTQLDISKINEHCENVENIQYSDDFTQEDRSEMVRQTHIGTDSKLTLPTSFNSVLFPFKEDIDSTSEVKSKLLDDQPEYTKADNSYFNQKYTVDKAKQNVSLSIRSVVVVNKRDNIKLTENVSEMDIPEKLNANIEFVGLIVNKSFDEEVIPKFPIIKETLNEKVKTHVSRTDIILDKPVMDFESDEFQKDQKSCDDEIIALEKDSALPPTVELDAESDCVERGYQEELHKSEGGTDAKSQSFNDILETITPSPDQSPRAQPNITDSPTGEYSPAAVSLSICRLDEAEELRKKQLAIELEIKALEQQSQLPYCLVREIPDKPPPPYIPPSELSPSPKNVTHKVTPKAIHTIESYCNWLWNQFSRGNSETITYNNFSKGDQVSTLEIKNKEYLFDICQETFEKEFSEIVIKPCKSWEYNKENKFKSFNKKDVCLRVEKKVKDILGLENSVQKDNLLVNWAHKRQDYVNDLLIKELYREEIDWVNIEENEIDVKNELTDSILDGLILEACQEYKMLYS